MLGIYEGLETALTRLHGGHDMFCDVLPEREGT